MVIQISVDAIRYISTTNISTTTLIVAGLIASLVALHYALRKNGK